MNNLSTDINWLLTQWAIWARDDGTSKLTQTSSAMFAALPSAKSGEYLAITDDEALAIEHELALLHKKHSGSYLCLFLTYYYNMTSNDTISMLKRIAGCSESCRIMKVKSEDLPRNRYSLKEKKVLGLARVERGLEGCSDKALN